MLTARYDPAHVPSPLHATGVRLQTALFALATLVGAALLFLVQPMLGKAVLPGLGGAPFVWVVCLAFFQVGLFLGYLWVHLAATRLTPRVQLLCQLGLVALALALSPLAIEEPPGGTERPALSLFVFLLGGAGLSYFALATTTPLLQRSFTSRTGRAPYALYAVSNAGSLLGLVAYPFVLEPQLSLDAQVQLWTLGFGLYGVLLLFINLLPPSQNAPVEAAGAAGDAAPSQPWTWFALAALPAVLLAAVSNHVTVDVAASPMLWVLMLGIYLISFMVAFAGERWHFPETHRGLWIACSVALPVMLLPGNQVPLPLMLGIPALTLWAGAMLCHGELARRSPEPARLTAFYLWLSAGGACGGGFVAFVAPVIFDGAYELPIALLGIHLLLARLSRRRDRRQAPTGAQRLTWLGVGLAIPLLLGTLYVQVSGAGAVGVLVERSRDFFGPLEVSRTSRSTVLTHGRTHHGKQLHDPELRGEPVAYFGPQSGAGRALRLHAAGRGRAIGVLGLGVGTLAAYARADDRMLFYEISPEVTRLARAHFSYLRDARGEVQVSHGDGRSLLGKEADGSLDVLLLDAFSSDSVPVHLLTVEAFAEYLRALRGDGVLAANVSNRHLAVERVVVGAARAHGLSVVIVESPGDRKRGLSRARWALMARRRELVEALLEGEAGEEAGREVKRVVVREGEEVVWTDRRSGIWGIVE